VFEIVGKIKETTFPNRSFFMASLKIQEREELISNFAKF